MRVNVQFSEEFEDIPGIVSSRMMLANYALQRCSQSVELLAQYIAEPHDAPADFNIMFDTLRELPNVAVQLSECVDIYQQYLKVKEEQNKPAEAPKDSA